MERSYGCRVKCYQPINDGPSRHEGTTAPLVFSYIFRSMDAVGRTGHIRAGETGNQNDADVLDRECCRSRVA
jgi:hydroxypyruvate isomerase